MKKRYEYNIKSRFGGYMPYIVYMKADVSHVYPFHISCSDFNRLHDNGCGVAYGRTPWGPWRRLKLFKYVIVGNDPVTDPRVIQCLDDKLNAYFAE